jgi:hypothetical protein
VTDTFNDDDRIQQDLVLETAQIAWQELQYFFARNMAVYVSDDLDLVDVATKIAVDNKAAIEQWMRSGKIAKVSNEQAKNWHAADAKVWAVVVKPWVLVQDVNDRRS